MTKNYQKIHAMTWSYSRLTTFEECPYKFFMKYLDDTPPVSSEMFYASYGTFMHKLIEKYHKGERTKEELQHDFLVNFSTDVVGDRPSDRIVKKYIESGMEYLKNITPWPYETVAVEKRINFAINGKPFVGVIDYIGRNSDGKLVIVDNKSRELKKRSGRKRPTVKDDELDSMMRQLYIYAAGVHSAYGEFPDRLCFNCFRNNVFIDEPFKQDAYDAAVNWAMSVINEAENTEYFNPNIDWFPCHWICEVAGDCCFVDVGEEE